MDASSLNQLFLAFIMLIPIVLLARTVVAGTKYSPILIIVVFGLLMGFLLERSGVATAGLPGFTIIGLMSKVTVIVLIVAVLLAARSSTRSLPRSIWRSKS